MQADSCGIRCQGAGVEGIGNQGGGAGSAEGLGGRLMPRERAVEGNKGARSEVCVMAPVTLMSLGTLTQGPVTSPALLLLYSTAKAKVHGPIQRSFPVAPSLKAQRPTFS